MSKREQLYFRRQELIELIESERAVIAHWHKAEPRARPSREKLPWHQVTVMLHLGEQNHVVFAQKFPAPGLRDEVNALRRAPGKHDLVRASRTDVLRHARPRGFVGISRARTQLVKPAV